MSGCSGAGTERQRTIGTIESLGHLMVVERGSNFIQPKNTHEHYCNSIASIIKLYFVFENEGNKKIYWKYQQIYLIRENFTIHSNVQQKPSQIILGYLLDLAFFHIFNSFKKEKRGSWGDSTECRVFALHSTNLGSIPQHSIQFSNLTGVTSEQS